MASENDITIEGLVEEIKQQFPLKETTEAGDLVIMVRENDDGQPAMAYAKIMGFVRDTSKRDEWWHVNFVFLEMPPVPRTIILQTSHFTGQEIFTMGGRKVFIKAVDFGSLSDERLTIAPRPKKSDESGSKTKSGKPTFTIVR